ncbi:hypothetical protein M0R04_01500 [Candidatus Dojkabacteria bacterium]|jgi:hypothetical protein|nr:hypothetical protein [Candidatus Dojkabacteria bacterium]
MKNGLLATICVIVFAAVFTSVFVFSGKNSSPASLPTGVANITSTPSSCIITVSGVKYDVTTYKNLHSGGNIFVCGTDMTTVFLSKHNSSYLTIMAKYKVI